MMVAVTNKGHTYDSKVCLFSEPFPQTPTSTISGKLLCRLNLVDLGSMMFWGLSGGCQDCGHGHEPGYSHGQEQNMS